MTTDPAPASGTVHWIGAGLSTGSGLAALCDTAGRVRLWHRTEGRAADAAALWESSAQSLAGPPR